MRDVGPFDDVTIEFPKGEAPKLADVYLLTGPNGTDKSSVLYALASDIDTEKQLEGLRRAKQRVLAGDDAARPAVEHIAASLENRSDELREITSGRRAAPELYELVCSWNNLFLSCTACNQVKQERWGRRAGAPGGAPPSPTLHRRG